MNFSPIVITRNCLISTINRYQFWFFVSLSVWFINMYTRNIFICAHAQIQFNGFLLRLIFITCYLLFQSNVIIWLQKRKERNKFLSLNELCLVYSQTVIKINLILHEFLCTISWKIWPIVSSNCFWIWFLFTKSKTSKYSLCIEMQFLCVLAIPTNIYRMNCSIRLNAICSHIILQLFSAAFSSIEQ